MLGLTGSVRAPPAAASRVVVVARWALPDRIFFGYGACHILAGTFLKHPPLEGFFAERIIPAENFSGNHVYVTNGTITFDHHGYSSRERCSLNVVSM